MSREQDGLYLPNRHEVVPNEDIDIHPAAGLAIIVYAAQLEPRFYKEIQAMPEAERNEWLAGLNEEIQSLVKNKTWTLIELPKGRKLFSRKLMCKLKRGAAGEILRYKIRWVVRGFK